MREAPKFFYFSLHAPSGSNYNAPYRYWETTAPEDARENTHEALRTAIDTWNKNATVGWAYGETLEECYEVMKERVAQGFDVMVAEAKPTKHYHN